MKQFPTHIVSVDGIIENDKNEILLVKNAHHNVWTVPGGQVEVGENLMDALKREIKEESGVDVTVNQLICVSSNTGTYQGFNGYGMVPTKVIFGFTCTYIGGELVPEESSECLWVSKDKVLDYIKVPNLVKRFEVYLNFAGDVQYLEYVTRPDYTLKMACLI